MTAEQRGAFAEIKQQVESHPGRLDLRKELAAMAVLLAKMWFSETGKDVQQRGKHITDSTAGSKVGYHIGLANRILESIPAEDITAGAEYIHIEEVLNDETA